MLTSPNFYQCYPKLFHTYFKKVDNEKVESLSQAGYQYPSEQIHPKTY